MAGVNLGTAYVQLEPTTDKLVPTMRRAFGGVETEAGKSGRRAGEKFADEGGKGTGGVKGLVAKLGLIGLGIEAGRRFVGEFGSAISEASDLEQSVGGLEAVFKDSFKQMDDSAKTAAKNLGLSRTEYNELATVLGAGLKNKGINDFAGQTQDLIGLGSDLAAMYGGTASDAVSAISSLMRGEADPIERFGVAISENAIKAELAATGQDKLTGAALESAKAQARLDILMRQTVDAHGALDRESDSVAAKQQRMAAQWDDIKGRIGTGLLPVVSALTGWFADRLLPAIEGVMDAWGNREGVWGQIRGVFEGIGTAVGTAAGIIGDFVGKASSAVGDFAQGAGAILFQGDFTGGLLGLEEDHPLVDLLFAIRERFIEVGAWITNVGMPIFSALWGGLKDSLMPVLELVGSYIFDVLVPYWSEMGRIISGVFGPAIDVVVGIIQNNLIPWWGILSDAFQAVVGVIRDKIVPTIQWFVQDIFLPAFRDVADFVTERVLPAIGQISDFIGNEVMPVVQDVFNRVIIPIFGVLSTVVVEAFKAIAGIVKWAWDTTLYPVLNGLWDILTNVVGPAVGWLWKEVIAPAFDGMGDLVENFGTTWADIWSSIQHTAAAPVNFVIGTIWNDGLRKLFNFIRGVFGEEPLPPMDLVSWGPTAGRGTIGGKTANRAFAAGGYTGDGDMWDPAGIVHRGEYVFTKREVQQAGGPSAIEQIKNTLLHGYAEGGLVGAASSRTTFRGKSFSALFAATLRAAEQLAGVAFGISQGGFRPRTSYSGTSHAGDAVDITSPVTSAVVAALRASGVAAWDRTGKGNWAPHIHGVPLPGRGYAGGSGVWQAQDYLRGGDGLGGRDNGPRMADAGGNLFDIPGIISNIAGSIGELTGPWGNLLRDAFEGVVDRVGDWVDDKLGGLFGRGYASGTLSAARGLSWVGERGPELVNFRGGERVYNAAESARMAGGRPLVVNLNIDGSTVRTIGDLASLISNAERYALQHSPELAPVGGY